MPGFNRVCVAAVMVASGAGHAAAGDKAPKAPKPYPISEHRYIKQFAGPTVACGSCFGFYRTQWRTWEEACNEPVPVDPGPKQYTPSIPVPPEPMKEPDAKEPLKPDVPKVDPAKPDVPKVDPAKPDVPKKKQDKKQNADLEIPTISIPIVQPPLDEKPAPLALPKPADKPTPAGNFEIVLPGVPQTPPGLLKPVVAPLPTVIVPVPSM